MLKILCLVSNDNATLILAIRALTSKMLESCANQELCRNGNPCLGSPKQQLVNYPEQENYDMFHIPFFCRQERGFFNVTRTTVYRRKVRNYCSE